ncbi:conjugal transfer protein TraN, partial [Acidithiobacillus sp. PG05]
AAQSLENALAPLTADLQGIIGGATGSVYANGNGDGAAILTGGYGSGAVTAASQEYQQIYGQCSYAQSYLENISTYPGGMNAYASDPMLNNFLSNPANQGMINQMMPFIESNPNVFSQYYQNVACTNNNVNITNAGTSATGPSTTTTSAPSIQSSPVACTEPLSAYTSTGWIDAADWPDPNAQWIYGTAGGCGAGVPNGTTDLMEGVYSNTTGAPLNATLYLAADDEGVVDINGTQVATYSDGGQGGDGAAAYPSTGGVVSVPITLSPGPDQIMYYITNAGGGTAANPSSGILTIIGTVNGTSQVLIDTNSNWVYVPQNAAQAGSTVTVNPGSVTTNTTPNTHAQSILCNSPIQCMGTECHALFGNQDLQFSQALTALSALQQMEQGAVCATGTSMAAGNCQPIIFGGTADYCRTWPAGGVFTNNCCAQGLQDAGQSGNLASYLELAHDTWKIANAPIVDAHVWGMKAFHSWVEGAYSTMDQWAAQGWGYVVTAFRGAADAVAQAFGQVGPYAFHDCGILSNSVFTSPPATKGLETAMENEIKGWLETAAKWVLKKIFGKAIEKEVMTFLASKIAEKIGSYAADAASIIGWVYLAYQVLQIIGNLLTACKNEEFKLGQKRKLHACQNLGTYCTDKFLGFCLEHKDVFCCYASPLSRIIAAQIKIGQPNVAGGYGTPQDPQCGGFTVQQLAAVDWSEVSLAQWQALLQSAGLIAGGNAQGSAIYTPAQIDHPGGDVNIEQAPIPVGHSGTPVTPVPMPTINPNASP